MFLLQVSSTPILPQLQVKATKTYFTTSTYYTTYEQKGEVLTKTRSSVRSRVVTETYSGGPYDYLPAPVQQTQAPLIHAEPQEKYLSLGPNIYGLVKTFYATYTYYTTNQQGIADESREVITQVSTSILSTTSLPSSIQVSTPTLDITPTASLQLDKDSLLSIKQSFVSEQGQTFLDEAPSLTASYVQLSENGPAVTQTLVSIAGVVTEELNTDFQPTPVLTTPATVGVSAELQSDEAFSSLDLPEQQDPVTRPTEAPSQTTPDLFERPSVGQPEDSLNPEQQADLIAPVDSETAVEASENSPAEDSDSFTNGLLGAVVGGISSALIPKPQNNGVNVDLGPVLDAVATLLRGPIRSAIANRRNTAAPAGDRSEEVSVSPTKVLNIPKFARVPSNEPNFIPVGEGGYSRYIKPSKDYGFIPLNGQQTYYKQILPRSDTASEIEANENQLDDIASQPQPAENIYRNNDPEYIVDENNPQIIDVLNKYEHSYLYNKHLDDPLQIKIRPGGQDSSNRPNIYDSRLNIPADVFNAHSPKNPATNQGQVNRPREPTRNQGAANRPREPTRNQGAGNRPREPSRNQGAGNRPNEPTRNQGAGNRPNEPIRNQAQPNRPREPIRNHGAGNRPREPSHSNVSPVQRPPPPRPSQPPPRPNNPPPRYPPSVPRPNNDPTTPLKSVPGNTYVDYQNRKEGLPTQTANTFNQDNRNRQYDPISGTRPTDSSASVSEVSSSVIALNQGQIDGDTAPPRGNYGYANANDAGSSSAQYADKNKPGVSSKKPTSNYKTEFNPQSYSVQTTPASYGEVSKKYPDKYPYEKKTSSQYNPSTPRYDTTIPYNSYGGVTSPPKYGGNRPSSYDRNSEVDVSNSQSPGFTPTQSNPASPFDSQTNFNTDTKKSRPNEVQIDVPTYGVPYDTIDNNLNKGISVDTKYTTIERNPPSSSTDRYPSEVSGTYGSLDETRSAVLGELEPSFKVTANFPVASTTFSTTQSKNKYDFEGWLTDGDPLKDLPPLRPTTAQSFDITSIQTEAPKTVTYANEWQTPLDEPTIYFVPQSPPPPPSNFEREWTTYQKGVNTDAQILRPTKSYEYSITETDSPKTITYANEWFANNVSPSQSKIYTNYQYVQETRRPGLGNARIDVVDLGYGAKKQPDQYSSNYNGNPAKITKEPNPGSVSNADPTKSSVFGEKIDTNPYVTPNPSNRARRPTQDSSGGQYPTEPTYSKSTRPVYPVPNLESDPSKTVDPNPSDQGGYNPGYRGSPLPAKYPSQYRPGYTNPAYSAVENTNPINPTDPSNPAYPTYSVSDPTNPSYSEPNPTNPTYSDVSNPTYPNPSSSPNRAPLLDFSGPGAAPGPYYGSRTTPGNVDDPSRTPTTTAAGDTQTYDPYLEYQDNYPDYNTDQYQYTDDGETDPYTVDTVDSTGVTNPPEDNYDAELSQTQNQNEESGVKDITVTSDGYKGFINVPTTPTTDREGYVSGNSDSAAEATSSTLEATDGSVKATGGIETISDGYVGYIDRTTTQPPGLPGTAVTRKPGRVRPTPDDLVGWNEGTVGLTVTDKPGRGRPRPEGGPDDQKEESVSLGHQFLEELVHGPNNGNQKRKYDKTVTREPNIVTKGEPTFINIDNTYSTRLFQAIIPQCQLLNC